MITSLAPQTSAEVHLSDGYRGFSLSRRCRGRVHSDAGTSRAGLRLALYPTRDNELATVYLASRSIGGQTRAWLLIL